MRMVGVYTTINQLVGRGSFLVRVTSPVCRGEIAGVVDHLDVMIRKHGVDLRRGWSARTSPFREFNSPACELTRSRH